MAEILLSYILGVLIGVSIGMIKSRHWLYYLIVFIWPITVPLFFGLAVLNFLFKERI